MSHARARCAVLAFLAVLAPAGLLGSPPSATAEEGEEVGGTAAEWIERLNRALQPSESMLADASVRTLDGFGGDTLLELEMAKLSDDEKSRTLIEVEAPEAARGTTFEIVAREDEIERRVWLPTLRRLRAIEGVSRTDPFLGTEFTYEDLALVAPVERREGSVRRIEVDGERLVEVVSEPYHYYGAVRTRIHPETALPHSVLFFDRAGQQFREQRFGDAGDGEHAYPRWIRVRNLVTGAESTLRFEELRFDADVGEARFRGSALRRRLERGADVVPEPAP